MADNYLERQMEQYEARKRAWEKSKKTKVKRPVKRDEAAPADTTQPTFNRQKLNNID